MKPKLHTASRALRCALALLSAFSFPLSAFSQPTAFTYQGRLNDGTNPASGIYDLRFAIYDAAGGGTQQGGTLTSTATPVTNGLFTVTLDFGNQFPGADRWLEIAVRTNGGGAFSILIPRQLITPTPYAITAGNVTGTVTAGQLTGTLAMAQLPGAVVTNGATGVSLSGTFTGNGAGLSSLDAAQLTSGTLPEARLPANVSLLGQGIDSTELVDGAIVNADINPAAAIADSKLATISTAGKVADSALSANVALLNRTPQQFTGTNVFTQRVGIGTTAPDAPLHVQSGAVGVPLNSRTVLALERNGDAWLQMLTPTNYHAGLIFGSPAEGLDASLRYNNLGARELSFRTLNSTRMVILTNGNVGIGNTLPSERLHVSGNVLASGMIQGDNIAVLDNTLVLGGTNVSAVDLKVGGLRILRVENPGDGNNDGDPFPDGAPNLIGGSPRNFVATGIVGAVIGGGGATNVNTVAYTNSVSSDFGVVAGGAGNQIGVDSPYGAIGGGLNHRIGTNSGYGTIAGGSGNRIAANAAGAAIGGGQANIINTNSDDATIAGGLGSSIGVNSPVTTIAGGESHSIGTNAAWSTISGGYSHAITPNGAYATVGGGRDNTATNYAFAAGYNAQATRSGSFVWSDSTGTLTMASTNNSVTFRASGGYRFFSSTSDIGVKLDAGATAWSVTSDRNLKKDFAPVDGVALLNKLAAMPIQQWYYQWEDASGAPHVGPMAQDFKAAFYPGRDDKSITTLEADGVALAAIQGLNEKVESGKQKAEAQFEELKAENAELKTRLSALEKMIAKLNANGN